MAYPAKDAQIIAFAFGGAVIGYSMMTDYPLAILRFVPFPVHRTLDFLLGAALLLSPIGFEVNGARAVLFVILGLFLIGLAFKTRGQFSRSFPGPICVEAGPLSGIRVLTPIAGADSGWPHTWQALNNPDSKGSQRALEGYRLFRRKDRWRNGRRR